MFALAWLDPNRKELILARDRFGVKPLVWEQSAGGARFASNLYALNALAPVRAREIDPESVRDYLLLGYVPAPRCIWRGPRKVMPGSYVQIRWRPNGEVETMSSAFWSIKDVAPAGNAGGGRTRTNFPTNCAVQFARGWLAMCRFRPPVTLGRNRFVGRCGRSVRRAARKGWATHVPAFTMGFSGHSERRTEPSPGAWLTPSDCARNPFLAVDENMESLFADTWEAFDEPFADSSALPMLLLCREVAKRVTVAIGGDGGDEVWCGYPWHRALYRAETLSWIPQLGRNLASVNGGIGQPNSQRGYMARVVGKPPVIVGGTLGGLKDRSHRRSREVPAGGSGSIDPPSEAFSGGCCPRSLDIVSILSTGPRGWIC